MSVEQEQSDSVQRSWLRRNLLRIVAVVVIVVVLAVVIAMVAYLSYRDSRSEPLKVDVYPDAEQIVDEPIRPGQDHQQYTVPATFELVAQFYEDQDDLDCERLTESETNLPVGRCIVDRSSGGMTQYTLVTFKEVGDGSILIDVRRFWED